MRCFFEPASPQALWLGRIKAQMNKLIYRRGLFGNEKMDHSANEIYLPHIRDMGAAFMKADTAEAASRWLAVISLWRCAGRSAEPAQLHFGGMSWSVLCDCVCVQAPTKKVGKIKSVPLIAGSHRHTDWMLAFGDDLVLQHGVQQYNSEAKMYAAPLIAPPPQPQAGSAPVAETPKGGLTTLRARSLGGRGMHRGLILTDLTRDDRYVLPKIVGNDQGKAAGTKIGEYIKALQPSDRDGSCAD